MRQSEAQASLPCRKPLVERRIPSTNMPKSVDLRLRSFAPLEHPYSSRRVNAAESRCPPDLFPSGAFPSSRWLPSLHVVSTEFIRSKSDFPRPTHLKVSIRLELEPTT
jgi:hypothetical protein